MTQQGQLVFVSALILQPVMCKMFNNGLAKIKKEKPRFVAFADFHVNASYKADFKVPKI